MRLSLYTKMGVRTSTPMSVHNISAKIGYIFLEIFHLELGVLTVIEQRMGNSIDDLSTHKDSRSPGVRAYFSAPAVVHFATSIEPTRELTISKAPASPEISSSTPVSGTGKTADRLTCPWSGKNSNQCWQSQIRKRAGIKIDKNASRNGIHLLLFVRIQRCLQSLGQLAR